MLNDVRATAGPLVALIIGVHGGAVARDGYRTQGQFGVNLGWAFGGGR